MTHAASHSHFTLSRLNSNRLCNSSADDRPARSPAVTHAPHSGRHHSQRATTLVARYTR